MGSLRVLAGSRRRSFSFIYHERAPKFYFVAFVISLGGGLYFSGRLPSIYKTRSYNSMILLRCQFWRCFICPFSVKFGFYSYVGILQALPASVLILKLFPIYVITLILLQKVRFSPVVIFMYRWLRILVCFLLITCLTINLSPLRAEATGLEAALVAVAPYAAPIAIAGIIIGLGVMASSNTDAFDGLVDSCTDAMTTAGYVVSGNVQGLYLEGKSYFSNSLVNAVRNWLWASGSLTSGYVGNLSKGDTFLFNPVANSFSGNNFYTLTEGPAYLFGFYRVSDSTTKYQMVVAWSGSCGSSLNVTSNGSSTSLPSSGNSGSSLYYRYNYETLNFSDYAHCPVWYDYNAIGASSYKDAVKAVLDGLAHPDKCIVSSELDVTLGNVISEDQDIEDIIVTIQPIEIDLTDYPEFQSPEEPDDSEDPKVVPFWPIATPGNYEDLLTMDQTTAQLGDTAYQPETSDPGSGSGSGGNSGTGSGSTGSWTPPSNHSQFALVDLKKYFPFCIPFDLFDFFSLLNADPVAPVFHWEIQDLSGNVYSLDIDLSEWDSVAQTFRLLQLFLFITGLAAASRKFIKW